MGAVQAFRVDAQGVVHQSNIGYSVLERVQPEHQAIDELLRHYGHWARDKRAGQHCGSVEWRYDAGGREVKQIGSPSTRRALDAERVFNAVIGLPQRHRLLINLWYVNRVDPRRIAVRVACPVRDLPALLSAARSMVRNRIGMTSEVA